jgi:hypothetical protein
MATYVRQPLALVAAAVVLTLAPTVAAQTAPPTDGVVLWGKNYELEDGQRLDGDLLLIDGDAFLGRDSLVDGTVIVWDGDVEVSGLVAGDVILSAGTIYLRDGGAVEGDVICSSTCTLEREDGSSIAGALIRGVSIEALRPDRWLDEAWTAPSTRALGRMWTGGATSALGWVLKATQSVVAVLVITVVAGLVALTWPESTSRVAGALEETSLTSFGLGLLTAVCGAALVTMLAVTICLLPLAALGAVVLGGLAFYGWIGVGLFVGQRLHTTTASHGGTPATPVWMGALGTLAITSVPAALGLFSCLKAFGWIWVGLLACTGLGAVVITRLGTNPHHQGTSALSSEADS